MLNYEQAGVSIKKADALTELIRHEVNSENIGMFAGLYEHAAFPEYYLVGCTDGVGTKIIPLIKRDKIETIAIDLIAMNLNDMICTGARPLFFLDYFAVNKLDVEVAARFIKALKQELAKYNCTLLGGETAELSDLVTQGHFDVAGFAVGLVKKDKILSRQNVKPGDIIIGLKSSGPHSNGYTLIRKVLSEVEMDNALEPTYIYVNEILELCDKGLIKACANITGGGLEGNLQRVIPEGMELKIDRAKIPPQSVFQKLLSLVGEEEAYKTFNMGVGMCVITAQDKVTEVMEVCKKYEPFVLGAL
ncbi:MAG: phosphoribosylformylglycinamidine cyclo-ligase [Candidatus Melainabacteria bacterium GWF2_37_15]|nr:MAG: phosphoribosylformylglycinamidine cyclo-ligase [Candidatus Melainabacteria bacterium GWF2_37_15]